MLEEIGLHADTIESESISARALKDRHLVVLPLNEDVPEKVADSAEGAGDRAHSQIGEAGIMEYYPC